MEIEVEIKCARCSGSGYENVEDEISCPACGGDGIKAYAIIDISDIMDRLDDIMNKCNDILEQVST